MRRPWLAALILVIGLLLLIDFLVVNDSLGEIADLAVRAAILVAVGAALAGAAALAVRRGSDLWRRRGDPVGAALVLAGMIAILAAGLRPGSEGSSDPAVIWLLAALVIPIGATLFALLFVSTLAASRRAVASRRPDGVVIVGAATLVLILLVPLGGSVGAWLAEASAWTLAVPIGAVFRGLLIGIALVAAVVAARTLFGIRGADD
ncbi:MAG TPA: hypothetical protein VLA76_00505 [Candidatus Angelobacter sp.]|nr:hypothetical protein [Candidatus Angelobacter sp.]